MGCNVSCYTPVRPWKERLLLDALFAGRRYRRVREFKGQMEENEETDCFSRHRMQVGFRKYVYLLLP